MVALPGSRTVVNRFVAGEAENDALAVAARLSATGLLVSLDRLGEDTRDRHQAVAAADAGVALIDQLAGAGLAGSAEISMKLTALGLDLDPALALEQATRVATAAGQAGTTVTVDMEGSAHTGATLDVVTELRQSHPTVGAVLQAYLRRTEADCHRLSGPGSRVRLCKGAYQELPSVAWQSRAEVSASYARCLGILMAGDGYPMVASHDPRLIALAGRLAAHHGRDGDRFEYQMLYGVRPQEQRRLAAGGAQVRVYVPYGTEWYGYLMRRLAERPANVAFFLRALGGTR